MKQKPARRIVALVAPSVYDAFEKARAAQGVRISKAAFAEAVLTAGLKAMGGSRV
jgi:hypothetical protein